MGKVRLGQKKEDRDPIGVIEPLFATKKGAKKARRGFRAAALTMIALASSCCACVHF